MTSEEKSRPPSSSGPERSFRLRIPRAGPPGAPLRDRDWSAVAAWWMCGVGGLQLIGLDLGGLVLLITASHIERKGPRAWWVAVVAHGLYLAGGVVAAAAMVLGAPVTGRAWGTPIELHEAVVAALLLLYGGIHLLPILMLTAPGTRRAFALKNRPTQCCICHYQLRFEQERCPECGAGLEPAQRRALAKERDLEQRLARLSAG